MASSSTLLTGDILLPVRAYIPETLAGLSDAALLTVCALIALLLVLVASRFTDRSGTARRLGERGEETTVVLVGPPESGKTAIWSKLMYGTVPQTHTSQRENDGYLLLGSSEDADFGEKASSRKFHLVDIPGHARLRSRALDFLPTADGVVFCVEASSLSRSGDSSGSQASASEVVEHLHYVLSSISRQRLRLLSRARTSASIRPPPRVLVLVTKSDATSSASRSSEALLARAKATLERELGRARSGMGVGRRGAGMERLGRSEGGAGPGSSNLFGQLLGALGLRGGHDGGDSAAVEEEEEDEAADEYDYISFSAVGSSSEFQAAFAFDKLDDEVVADGRVELAAAGLGKERGWAAKEEKRQATSGQGLSALKSWMVELE